MIEGILGHLQNGHLCDKRRAKITGRSHNYFLKYPFHYTDVLAENVTELLCCVPKYIAFKNSLLASGT